MHNKPIIIYGAGAYGTALALNFQHHKKSVILVTKTPEHAHALKTDGENKIYLPGIALNNLHITADHHILRTAGIIFLVVPVKAYASALPKLKSLIMPDTPIVSCSKGILDHAPFLLSDAIHQYMPNPVAIWSGPHFAMEAAQYMPSALTLACKDMQLCKNIIGNLSTPSTRLYGTCDTVSVQIAGALKNVIAIACGIAKGLGYGQNTMAALMTRGLGEIRRLALALGGRTETLLGLSCVGDLTLTCFHEMSRNMSLGIAIGKGGKASDLIQSSTAIAEGYYTAYAAYALNQLHNVRMPILDFVYQILYDDVHLHKAMEQLLLRHEIWEDE